MFRRLMPLLLAAVTVACGPQAEDGPAAGPAPAKAAASAVGQNLVCDEGDEARALLSAPKGAKRMSEHALTVTYGSGVREFADRKPYGEDLDRHHWTYCGYMPTLKAHLVGLQDGDLFSGKLLREDGGQLIDAGQAVFPAPDGERFLAAEQFNGADLQQWTVADLAGRKLWVGDSGVVKDGSILITYETPRWISNSELRADATCGAASGTKGLATFTIKDGSGRWESDLECTA